MSRIKHMVCAILLFCYVLLGLATEPILVVGHKAPDSDSVAAAIAVASLKTLLGQPAQAVVQGALNPETRFLLDRYGLAAPAEVQRVAGRKVFLVDHSDYPLAPDDLKSAEIVGLVDHHKLGGLQTGKPIEGRVAPVGASATIVARMFAEAGVEPARPIAGLLLGAILSDTVIFKSPTATAEDRAAAEHLAKLAGEQNLVALGTKLFEVKSEIAGSSAEALLRRDLKMFTMGGRKIAVAQLELVNLEPVRAMRESFLAAMRSLKAQESCHSVLLMLTDIMQEGSELLLLSDEPESVASALKFKAPEAVVWLPGVMSRKKQIIPPLEMAFK